MSREFGDCNAAGFFHQKIAAASEDCEGGFHAITQLTGQLLDSMGDMCYAIASTEGGDSGPASLVETTIASIPKIEDALRAISREVSSTKEIIERALVNLIRKQLPAPQQDGDLWTVKFNSSLIPNGNNGWRIIEKACEKHVHEACGTYVIQQSSSLHNDSRTICFATYDSNHNLRGRFFKAKYEESEKENKSLQAHVVAFEALLAAYKSPVDKEDSND